MSNVLNVNNCLVQIKKEAILQDVSFQVNQGEIIALVGHNGAGKSTLIKTIVGSLEKQNGEIFIQSVEQDNDYSAYKKKLSYIPEEPLLMSELTVYHHFQLYQKSYQIADDIFKHKVATYTKAFEIEDKLDEYPESLSKGMRQKVQTICALLPDVPLLLIDEPFMGLDVYAGVYLEKVLRERKAAGGSTLITTHQLEKVKELADRYVMLRNGKVSEIGAVANFETLDRRNPE